MALPIPVEPTRAVGRIGLDENEWRDDPAALSDWDDWLKTLEPFEYAPGEEEAFRRIAEQMRQFNVEAVRQQVQAGDDR